MDFRFPELPAQRDPSPESVQRHRERSDTGFADYLDSSLREQQVDEPRDSNVREPAPRQEPVARDARDARPARAAKNAAEEREQTEGDYAHAPDTTAPAPRSDAAAEKPGTPDAAVSVPDVSAQPASDDAAEFLVPTIAQAAAPAVQSTPPLTGPQGKGASAAAAPAQPVPPQSDAGAPVPAPSPAQGKEALEAAAQPPKPQTAKPAGFTGELAAATAKSPEPAPAPSRPQSNIKTQPVAGQPASIDAAAATDAVTAPVVAVGAPSGDNGRDAAENGNRSFTPPQPNPPATQPAAAPAADETDAAQIAAVVRHAANAVPAQARPADTVTPNPIDLAPADLALDAPPAAPASETAKPDAPSRPFGNVAPGLSVAAQITAQQTPDQANAAERIAQIAAAKEAVATPEIATTVGTDAAQAADAPATPAKLDQAPPVELANARTISVDAAAAAAAARHARPAFHPVVAQVAMHVAQAVADGNDRINIRLSPAELGRIDVRLDFGPDGRVQAVFAADRPQTVELLQRDARDLERALQDAGLRADSGSLSFNLRGDGRNGAQSFAEMAGNGRREHAAGETAAAPQVQAYTAGSAAPGRIDIRI